MYRVVPSYFQCWKVRKSLLLMEWRILRFQLYGQTTKRDASPSHFSNTAILLVPSRGVIATPPTSSPIPPYSNTKRSEKNRDIFSRPRNRQLRFVSVDTQRVRTAGKIYTRGWTIEWKSVVYKVWLFPFNRFY